MTPGEILRDARQRIADPAHWCRFVLGTTAEGNPTLRGAVRFCATGSLYISENLDPGYRMGEYYNFLTQAARDLFDRAPTYVNDMLGHEATLQMFDRAIALAEGETE